MKTPNPRQRWFVLGSLLVATLAAALWIDDEPAQTVAPAERPAKRQAGPEARSVPGEMLAANASGIPAAAQPVGEATGDGEAPGIDPFRSKTWYVAPPPPPPPRPVAPPLPFRYLGQIIEDQEIRVFVSNQNRQLTLKAGDTVDGNYRVEAITPGQVSFVYLLLKQQQIMAIGKD